MFTQTLWSKRQPAAPWAYLPFSLKSLRGMLFERPPTRTTCPQKACCIWGTKTDSGDIRSESLLVLADSFQLRFIQADWAVNRTEVLGWFHFALGLVPFQVPENDRFERCIWFSQLSAKSVGEFEALDWTHVTLLGLLHWNGIDLNPDLGHEELCENAPGCWNHFTSVCFGWAFEPFSLTEDSKTPNESWQQYLSLFWPPIHFFRLLSITLVVPKGLERFLVVYNS